MAALAAAPAGAQAAHKGSECQASYSREAGQVRALLCIVVLGIAGCGGSTHLPSSPGADAFIGKVYYLYVGEPAPIEGYLLTPGVFDALLED